MTREEMEKSGYHAVLLDAYHFLRKYGKVEGGDRFWEDVAAEATAIAKRHEGTPVADLTNALLVCVCDELGRKGVKL